MTGTHLSLPMMFDVDQYHADLQAGLARLVAEQEIRCHGGVCWGNWLLTCYGPRDQYLSLPVGIDPNQTVFGVGWLPWMPSQTPGWVSYSRHLDESGGIDLMHWRYLQQPHLVQMNWSPYVYRGLGPHTPQPRWW